MMVATWVASMVAMKVVWMAASRVELKEAWTAASSVVETAVLSDSQWGRY